MCIRDSQCIELAQRINAMGGSAKDPQEYKDEYVRRLLRAVDGRRTGLADGTYAPADWLVPGSQQLLAMLRRHGITMYLASGTDDGHVKEEAALLGLTEYFGPHIYGAQRDYKTFSKKMVIERILRENQLPGEALLGFGDGYVEIEDVKAAGGFACGVASNEKTRQGVDAVSYTHLDVYKRQLWRQPAEGHSGQMAGDGRRGAVVR